MAEEIIEILKILIWFPLEKYDIKTLVNPPFHRGVCGNISVCVLFVYQVGFV